MAGPKEEWLQWDRRFQFGYSCLNQRLKATEEATQQITQLEEQTKTLTASSKHLREDNDGLKDRIQKLEKASYQMVQLNEQIQDLTASSRSLKEENNVLLDRILQLEQEGTHRDGENRLAQQQLEEKLNLHEENSRSMVVSISGMHEIATAERDQRGEEIQRLRSQVEALIATKHTSRGHTRDVSASASTRHASNITEDERAPTNRRAIQQPNAACRDIRVRGVLIKAQGPSTLFEDHLRYAENAFKRFETEAVQAFVSSVQAKHGILLGNKLGEHDEWTWQAAKEESYRILETEKRAKRRSARLIAATPQPS